MWLSPNKLLSISRIAGMVSCLRFLLRRWNVLKGFVQRSRYDKSIFLRLLVKDDRLCFFQIGSTSIVFSYGLEGAKHGKCYLERGSDLLIISMTFIDCRRPNIVSGGRRRAHRKAWGRIAVRYAFTLVYPHFWDPKCPLLFRFSKRELALFRPVRCALEWQYFIEIRRYALSNFVQTFYESVFDS